MEAAAGVDASRGGSLAMASPSSSQSGRKEWRAVSDQSVRSAGTEELERSKLGQSDERTIYEVQQGSGPLDVDFCSIAVEGGLENDLLQQRLHSVSRQRVELQGMEVKLRAQVIARSEIMEMQKRFDAQMKEQVDELKEKLQEKEQEIYELELKMEEKDRELRAIKIDSEVAWAKEDLLREQNKELATFRRERDNSEVERAQHLKQMHELKEHIQEKDRQFLELEEQHRVAQETILYKDEQLREIQAWVARVQEVDHSIQAEMRERTDHFNQFWLGCQRQFADMERHHLQTVQQLQLELAEARERNGIYTDEPRTTHADSKDTSPFLRNKMNQFNINESVTLTGNSEVLPNGNVENGLPFVSTGNASSQAEHAAGVPIVPSSLLGMGAYIPPGQMTAMHPFVVHQQGIQHSVPSVSSHVAPSHAGHYQPIPGISSHQYWQNQQTLSEGLQISSQNQYLPSQSEQSLVNPEAHYDYEISGNGHVLHSDYLSPHISPSEKPGPVTSAHSEESQVIERLQPNLQEDSSKFHESLGLESIEQNSESKEQGNDLVSVTDPSQEGQGLAMEQKPLSATQPINSHEATGSSSSDMPLPEGSASTGRALNSQSSGKFPESALLDERQLLSCIVRAIPAGSNGQIRISATLPNRLGKMLAPLHWHDYKKKYGKLDDFVAGHPELFVIEGDFIQLREGAQEIISATAAMAKVAAAVAASAPYSSLLPSVAVTPMAQNHRLKRVPSIDSKPVKIGSTETAAVTSADVGGKPLQLSVIENQHSNGVPYNIIEGLSNVKFLGKSRDPLELNGLQSEFRHGRSVHMTVANGANPDKIGSVPSQGKVSSNGRQGVNFGGKQQGRATVSVLTPRR